ncbi:MAG: HAD family phosphatase [Thermoguttaceae bacterium]|nr:HAD family phosphatase [Thermoguttaceae bacterium]MBQ2554931.1 HAD family phosphatase [Thermoguttaceae bacterium]MBQ4203293.1 HAD family phosphatase [Thermoguttaceae bacterium]
MEIIFDMDGVLINSNAAHLASWKKIAAQDGVSFSDEVFWKTFGMTSEYIVEKYWGNTTLTTKQISAIVDRKETAFRESVKEFVQPIEGSVDFVRFLLKKGYKMAVGSSAPRVNVEYVLDWLEIRDCFNECVVAGDEVKQGKPAPDIFLTAAKKLNTTPENCVVIDDSRSGVNAGKNAGMTTIGFFSAGHSQDEYENADYVVRSFEEIKKILHLGE